MYSKYFKRFLDVVFALLGLTILSPLFVILIVIGAVSLKGNPFFTQLRPGKDERIFRLIKFRTMTNEMDPEGKLLPDQDRLTKYGSFLRDTSLDELPELINILLGDMSFVGPRPLLVRDMVFMTQEQRKRHTVRSGLTGLAQASGRNALHWERKLELDLEYVQHVSFWGDLKILCKTVVTVLRRDGIAEEGMATAEDYGDYLLREGLVTAERYCLLQEEAQQLQKV